MRARRGAEPAEAGWLEDPARLGLAALSLVLLILPLLPAKPGTPPTFKGDEPAYFLMAESLVQDLDLRCEERDLQRLFEAYPYLPANNLILGTPDGWRTLYYAKPFLLSALAAPLVAIFGANGMVAFNMLLLVAMIWMGAVYLGRWNPFSLAALFSAGFFLASIAFLYVFWLHTEILNLFATSACLFFAFRWAGGDGGGRERGPGLWRRLAAPAAAPWWSGAALALGVYNKPMLVAMALPAAVIFLRRRNLGALLRFAAGAVLCLGLAVAGSWLLIGRPTPYLGLDRAGINLHNPYYQPLEAVRREAEQRAVDAEGEALARAVEESGRGWSWIFRLPPTTAGEVLEDTTYFFSGRHTGLFLYTPFALLCLLLFAFGGRPGPERWALLFSLVAVGLFFLLFIPFNWQGGGGFVGNRYFVMVYPGFLFLVRRIRTALAPAAGFGLAGLLPGLLLFSPYGVATPAATLQHHVRAWPFSLFPFELSLREVPGYSGIVLGDLWLRAFREQVQQGEGAGEVWVEGGRTVEIWVQAGRPLEELAFEVRSPVPENPVRIRVGGSEARLVARPEWQRVVLTPVVPTRVRLERTFGDYANAQRMHVYRLRVRAERGELPRWRERGQRFFYLGAELRLASGEIRDLPDDRPRE